MPSVSIDGSLWFTSRQPLAAWKVYERESHRGKQCGVSLCKVYGTGALPQPIGQSSRAPTVDHPSRGIAVGMLEVSYGGQASGHSEQHATHRPSIPILSTTPGTSRGAL
ncbi:hypothetical protein SAMN05216387_12111 [Nitrosovibrio tenuis]|uniref:Uncharacterized protein n=1 Tax=Nitrosovibrio tenuis TaxID=1233 RepID=A0A1H7RWW2_9PROT|nr:hypothetical protein SAMN05216387_12111 [Nitrosovibrio tenuis]